jgi:hypothetical protein
MADNVFINGRAAAHKGSMGKSVAFPDVCLCPPAPPSGPIPTPLVNTAQAADLDGCAATVTVQGNRIANAQSFVAKSTGNEVAQSTGGGIMTQVTQGKAYFQTFSMNVMIENQPAVRYLDLVTNNHAAKMAGNTPPVPWMSTMQAGPGPAPGEMEKVVGKKKDWITIKVVDQEGHPAARVQYCVTTPEGKKVEGRLVHGGRIALRRIDTGSCTVEFPKVSAVTEKVKEQQPDALPYRNSPMKLQTGRVHLIQVKIPRVLHVELPIDPSDASYAGHRFILRSKDGCYEAKRTVGDDAVAGDRKLTLEFAEMLPDKLYSLIHDDGQGMIGTFFFERPYEQLFPASGEKKLTRSKPTSTTAAPTSMFGQRRFRPAPEDDLLLDIDSTEGESDGSADSSKGQE